MTHFEENVLASSIRKHCRDKEILVLDIAARLIDPKRRNGWIKLATKGN